MRAALDIKRVFGNRDQDIEWAYMKGQIYIVSPGRSFRVVDIVNVRLVEYKAGQDFSTGRHHHGHAWHHHHTGGGPAICCTR